LAKVRWCEGEQIIEFPENFSLELEEITIRSKGRTIILEPVDSNAPENAGDNRYPGPWFMFAFYTE